MHLDRAVITETERIDEWATQDIVKKGKASFEYSKLKRKRANTTGEKHNLDRDADLG